jgi:microcystin-dependent protein
MRGRATIAAGQGTGLNNRVLGASGGVEQHPLTIAELASHTHGVTGGPFMVYSAGSSVLSAGGTLISTQNLTAATGSGTAHNNMSPFLVTNKMVKF